MVPRAQYLSLIFTIVGIAVTLGAAEMSLRAAHLFRPREAGQFRVAPLVYGQFGAQYGQRLAPHSRLSLSVIQDNAVVWCFGVVVSANADGLGGRTTLAQARAADDVIPTTGDSFTHWQQSGLTIPDVVENILQQHTGRRVANLNFGRGTYGVLQMLTIAAGLAPDAPPRLIVVQIISDDLTRGRWWTRERVVNGRTRAMLSARQDGFDDPRLTNDEYVVDPRATPEWCERQRVTPQDDGVARDATAFYRSYLQSTGRQDAPLSLTRSYLVEWVRRRLGIQSHLSTTIPRVTWDQFVGDAGYRDAITALRRSGIPLLFIHLPTKKEIVFGRPILDENARRIWNTLEADFGTRIVTYTGRPVAPAIIDLMPHDGHPNLAGITFYGEYVALAIRSLRQPSPTTR